MLPLGRDQGTTSRSLGSRCFILSWVKRQYSFKLRAVPDIYLPDGELTDDVEGLLRITDSFPPQFLSRAVFIHTESTGRVNSISCK